MQVVAPPVSTQPRPFSRRLFAAAPPVEPTRFAEAAQQDLQGGLPLPYQEQVFCLASVLTEMYSSCCPPPLTSRKFFCSRDIIVERAVPPNTTKLQYITRTEARHVTGT